MEIKTTQQAEKERIANRVPWATQQGTNMVTILHAAKDLGWKEKKVQVRREFINGENIFTIEPYEEGCGCRGLLKYHDYFD